MAITQKGIEDMQRYYLAQYGQEITEEEASVIIININTLLDVIEEKRAFDAMFGVSEE